MKLLNDFFHVFYIHVASAYTYLVVLDAGNDQLLSVNASLTVTGYQIGLIHWIPLHNINCAHLSIGLLFNYSMLFYINPDHSLKVCVLSEMF